VFNLRINMRVSRSKYMYPATLVVEIMEKSGNDYSIYRYVVIDKKDFDRRMVLLHQIHSIGKRPYKIYLVVQSNVNKVIPKLND
jgi:hypothetical protein